MEIKLKRNQLNLTHTLGQIHINGELICYSLEDTDRGLKQDMSLREILKKKIYKKTAIPYGTYRVSISFSNHLQCYCPELHNVPGFSGIRIHPGNTEKDTDGCILPGMDIGTGTVKLSRLAFIEIMERLTMAEKSEEITITIE